MPNEKVLNKLEKVRPSQLNFITEVMATGNATQSYLEAYPESSYDAARSNSSRMLANPRMAEVSQAILEKEGWNDLHMDVQLLNIVKNTRDPKVKLSAIKHYNEIMGRLKSTLEVKVEPAFNLSKLSDDELVTFLELAEKAKK